MPVKKLQSLKIQSNMDCKDFSSKIHLAIVACQPKDTSATKAKQVQQAFRALIEHDHFPLPLPESNTGHHTARKTERKCWEGQPCLYFYAGRWYPGYGNVAFAFEPACEIGRFHSATPFDSGGVMDDKCKFSRSTTPPTEDERIGFIKSNTIQYTRIGETYLLNF